MRAFTHIVAGRFFGAEIEPGTFHVLAVPPARSDFARDVKDTSRPQGPRILGAPLTGKAAPNAALPPQAQRRDATVAA
jgi:hypothetical protein